MLEHMDSRELTEWGLLYALEAEEAEDRKHGGVVEHGLETLPPEDDSDDDEPDEGHG